MPPHPRSGIPLEGRHLMYFPAEWGLWKGSHNLPTSLSVSGFLEPQPMSQYVDNHSASSALSEQKVIKLLRNQFQSCFSFLI